MDLQLITFFSLLSIVVGFVIGLGAVNVIDIIGFLGQKSNYWSKTAIAAHKVTKPLIWIGILLVVVGEVILYSTYGWYRPLLMQIIFSMSLIANGAYLSWFISPQLLEMEKKKTRKNFILPTNTQDEIFRSFMISVLGWWFKLFIFVLIIHQYLLV